MSLAYEFPTQSLTQLPKPGKNPAYLRFLRTLPCCICFLEWTVEACHTGPRGLNQRASDLDAIPLCRKHHRHARVGLDQIGRVNFEALHGVEIRKLIELHQLRAEACGIDLTPEPKKRRLRRT